MRACCVEIRYLLQHFRACLSRFVGNFAIGSYNEHAGNKPRGGEG
jgi:hypothetical protein